MTSSNKTTVEARGDRELIIRRSFNAPKDLVFRAHTECSLLKRWMFGPDGWTLAVCEIDLRVGGRYRWVWKKDEIEMGAGGEYKIVERPDRISATERFDQSWYPGEAVSLMTFEQNGSTTLMTNTMTYESKDARDAVLASPMEEGLDAGYNRLEAVLVEEVGE